MNNALPPSGLPALVGVLGGGRMGAGIAHAFLTKGADVRIVERDEEAASAARQRVTEALEKSAARGTLGSATGDVLSRLTVSTEYSSFAGCSLVIEAVPEDLQLKLPALLAVEEQLRDDAYLASNTSSLSVDTLATELIRPENFLGLHFFNPVPASTLVEVVLGKKTSAEVAAAANGWVEALGKTPVVVHDAPGFASSRLGVAVALEAMRMVEEGVASAEDIDAAMVLGYKHDTGPLRTTDIVGLDVRLGIAAYLHSMLGERFRPPQILVDKVARGEIGRKAGRGFFDWTS
jgi:3-hydroxybutyryl-CoA dehydrogenase